MENEVLQRYQALYSTLPGFFTEQSMVIWDFFFKVQATLEIRGDLLEIGVYKGKSAVLAAMYASPEESCVFVDINPMTEAEEIIQQFHPENNVFLRHSSLGIQELPEIRKLYKKCRWIHIDGNHQGYAVHSDLELAAELLTEDGLICVDDFFNYRYPQLTMAVYAFLREYPEFVMLFCGSNKGYLCRRSKYNDYELHIRTEFLEAMTKKDLNIQLNKSSSFSDGGCFSVSWNEYGRVFVGLDEDTSKLVT